MLYPKDQSELNPLIAAESEKYVKKKKKSLIHPRFFAEYGDNTHFW